MCGSLKAYKKCECSEIDLQRTKEFIEGKQKEVDVANAAKPKGIIIV